MSSAVGRSTALGRCHRRSLKLSAPHLPRLLPGLLPPRGQNRQAGSADRNEQEVKEDTKRDTLTSQTFFLAIDCGWLKYGIPSGD